MKVKINGIECEILSAALNAIPDPASELARLKKLDGNDDHIENRCERCTGRNLHSWYADSDVWNKVAGDYSVLCPICFTDLAREKGIDPSAWRISVDGDDPEVDKLRVRIHELLSQESTELSRLKKALDDRTACLASALHCGKEKGCTFCSEDLEILEESLSEDEVDKALAQKNLHAELTHLREIAQAAKGVVICTCCGGFATCIDDLKFATHTGVEAEYDADDHPSPVPVPCGEIGFNNTNLKRLTTALSKLKEAENGKTEEK